MKKVNFRFIVFCENSSDRFDDWTNIGYLITGIKELKNITYDVKFYEYDEINKIVTELEENTINIVGLSLLQTNYIASMKLVSAIKEKNSSIQIICGGKEATYNPMYIMENNPGIDILCIGEGEYTLREVLYNYVHNITFEKCRGIVYRSNGNIVLTERRIMEQDIDKFGFPDRSFGEQKKRIIRILTTRGCTGHCTFCDGSNPINSTNGTTLRNRSIKQVVDEMELVLNTYQSNYFNFMDSTFTKELNNNEWYEMFYQELKKRNLGVRFWFFIRAEQIDEDTIEALRKLQSVGLDYVSVGIESGYEKDLRLYGKIATVKDNIQAVKFLKNADIMFDYGFIMFNPYSTLESLTENIKFLRENRLIITPETLSKRLWIFSGSSIIKKLHKDNLLTCKPNQPIIDYYGYKMINKEVEKIWEYMNEFYGRLPLMRFDLIKFRSLMNEIKYKKINPDLERVAIVKDKINNLVYMSNKICIELFEKLIYLIKNDDIDENSIQYIIKKNADSLQELLSDTQIYCMRLVHYLEMNKF